MEIWGALVIVCNIMTRDGEDVGATVILIGDAEGDLVIRDNEGASVNGGADGESVSSSPLSQGVLGKHAKPGGHSALLPPGQGFKQLVDAS
jgi:hypothetical protein